MLNKNCPGNELLTIALRVYGRLIGVLQSLDRSAVIS